MKKIGIIGSGNMGSAILSGIIKSNLYKKNEILISDKNENSLKKIKEQFDIDTTTDNLEIAKNSELILFAVKPNIIKKVLNEIKNAVNKNQIFVSIAVGIKLEDLITSIGSDELKIARVMPNTPALVGEGMSVIAFGKNFNEEEKKSVENIFAAVGKVMTMDESYLDAVGAVSSSSPAFVFMFIESLADAGVLGGLKRADAYELAAQTILGSAKLYLDTKTHPAALKDAVCSPAGTTIEGVKVLEEKGFRSSVIDAVDAVIEKSKKIAGK